MLLLLTTVLPFLAHNHASAAAFLTSRHHNFHGSIIPEFLSDEERVKSFCEARQQSELKADNEKQYKNLYNLFVQTPLMQFSPSLIVSQKNCAGSILEPLLATKYFTRSLQRCFVISGVPLSKELLQALSKIRTLSNLDLGRCEVNNNHLEIIINSFPSLENLTVARARQLKRTIRISSPPPPAKKTLRNLTLKSVDFLFATQFVPNFPNLRKLVLFGLEEEYDTQKLDLQPLSSSLPLLKELDLRGFTLKNTEALKNLVTLSSLRITWCTDLALSFLSQESSLPELRTLCIDECKGFSPSSFASLSHVSNLQVLEFVGVSFDNDCLKYLENMVHLRKLKLNCVITGDCSEVLKTLMHKSLLRLEELDLSQCDLGNEGAIAGALYSTHSCLRVLNLEFCFLVDDDLDGIAALKNTLEELDLSSNYELTNEALKHCGRLVKMKSLMLVENRKINDLSPLRDCLSLEELDVEGCDGLTDDSFQVFSEEPNSFPKLHTLNLLNCDKLYVKFFEHLSKNNHLVHQLKELKIETMLGRTVATSATARNKFCELKGLRWIHNLLSSVLSQSEKEFLEGELMRRLKNLEWIR